MNVGDIVKTKPWAVNSEAQGYGIILDTYEDTDGICYFEVHWNTEVSWWPKLELELVSENN